MNHSEWVKTSARIPTDNKYLTLEQFGGSITAEDNSVAWTSMLAEYDTGDYDYIQLGEGQYKIIEPAIHKPAVDFKIYGIPGKTSLKFFEEESTHQPSALFNLGSTTPKNWYSQDVYWLRPETFIPTAKARIYNMFTGMQQGHTEMDKAPVVAIVNTIRNTMSNHLGIGTITFKGLSNPNVLLSKCAYGFLYLENVWIKGIGVTNINVNRSGGGTYWGMKGCRIETGDESEYATLNMKFKGRITSNRDGFSDFVKNADYFPLAIETDKDNRYWPELDAYSSRSGVIQIKGKNGENFVFHAGNQYLFSSYYPQFNGAEPTPDLSILQSSYKRLLAGIIPKAGETYTMSREYETNLGFEEMRNEVQIADKTKNAYIIGRLTTGELRSQIAWSTYWNKYGQYFTESEVEFMKSRPPIFLQVGDVVEVDGFRTTMKWKTRGRYVTRWQGNQCGHTFEYHPFDPNNRPPGFSKWNNDPSTHESYAFDPPLPVPEDAKMLVEVKIIKSQAEYLNDEPEVEGTMSWLNIGEWKQTDVTQSFIGKGVRNHTYYNQREVNHDFEDCEFPDGFYRQNNMNWKDLHPDSNWDLEDPDTGEVMNVRGLAAYPFFGDQHVNTDTPKGSQYGRGYDKFMPQRDLIIRNQGIEEEYVTMQRNIGNVDQPQMVVDPYYTTTERRPRPQRLLNILNDYERST